MKRYLKFICTSVIVAIAVGLVLFKYQDYVKNPWTRDGQVRADVVQVTSRISGPIVSLPIRDNQFVEKGDLLFEIDPRTFQASVDQARAQLDETGDNVEALLRQVEMAKAGVNASKASIEQAQAAIDQLTATIDKNKSEYERKLELLPKQATSQRSVESAKASYEVSLQKKISAQAGLRQSHAALAESEASLAESEAKLGAVGEKNSQVRASVAALKQAELNLEFTKVRASVDGYVTNLNLQLGTQAVANQPLLALVDVNSYWISGFFKENSIAEIESGNRAVVTLMTYPDSPVEGRVDSIGWGIAQQDGSTGYELLPSINPTFEWIRLAQRVPIRIHLKDIPEGIKLRVGTTCSVLVMTGNVDGDESKTIPAAPKALQ